MKANRNLFAFSLIAALSLGISACDDEAEDNIPENDLCQNATSLAIGENVSGITNGAKAEVYVDSSDAGVQRDGIYAPDVYYKVTIDQAGSYEFLLSPLADEFLPHLAIWKSCKPADLHEPHHEDFLAEAEGNNDSHTARIGLKLEPGTYILFVNPRPSTPESKSGGFSFQLSYRMYDATTPELASAKASFKYITETDEELPYSLVNLRLDGKDSGKDLSGVILDFFNAGHATIEPDDGHNRFGLLFPKYDENGQFKDAFLGYRVLQDLSSAMSVSIRLLDQDGEQSEPLEVELSHDFEVVSRDAGETCDREGYATSCSEGTHCSVEDDNAALCR